MDLDDLLKSIREEGNKGGSIVPAKFFGEDRYERYVAEISSQGTLEGKTLTPSERKEAFKKRKNKIDFQNFVDNLLAKKAGTGSDSFAGGGDGGAIVKSSRKTATPRQRLLPGSIATPVPSVPDLQSPEIEDDLGDIDKKLDDLLNEIRRGNNEEKKSTEKQRKESEREKRSKREDKRESIKNFLAKPIEKVLAPIQNFFDKIIGGLVKILLAKALVKFIDWFADPANQEKIDTIGRFIKDFWPGIIGGLLLIGTGLGSFATKLLVGGVRLIGSLLKMTLKLGVIGARLALKGGKGLLKLAGANPLATGLVLAGGTAAVATGVGFMKSQEEEKKQVNKEAKERGVKPEVVKKELEQAKRDPLAMMGDTMMSVPLGFSGGGKAKSRGTDVVPAMLTPGEFIMSKGAVDTFGTDFMESINAAGGGTNRPQKVSGTFYAQGGGYTKRNKPKSTTDGEVDTAKGTNQKEGEGGASAVVSAGKMLLSKGFTVAEHTNFRKNSYSGSGSNKGVGFNPTGGERVGGHSPRSLHYKNLAIDVTDWRPGDWQGRTAALAETMYQNRDKLKLTQIIHDPWGSWFAGGGKGGAIGGHDTHLHLGFASGTGEGGADLGDFTIPEGSYASGGGGGGDVASAITPISPLLAAEMEKARLMDLAYASGQSPQQQASLQKASNDVPQLGSIDPENTTLFVMRSMYNLGG